MRRLTVRDDTFKSSAVSSIVRSLVRGRPGVPVLVVRDADLEVGRCGGLEVRVVERFRSPRLRRGGFALTLPFKTSAVGNAARHADPVESGAPALRPRLIKHGPRHLLCRAELIDWIGRVGNAECGAAPGWAVFN